MSAVAARLTKRLGLSVLRRNLAVEEQQPVLRARNWKNWPWRLVIFFIMIVAAFNIVGTLTMVVAFKTREIGILQAMGLSARGVARIFLAQGAIVGVLGTEHRAGTRARRGEVVDKRMHINPEIYFIDRLPVHVEAARPCWWSFSPRSLSPVLATIPSSRHASRLVPVDAIRAE